MTIQLLEASTLPAHRARPDGMARQKPAYENALAAAHDAVDAVTEYLS